MDKKLLFAIIFLFPFFLKGEAQTFTGKPQYKIHTKRAGVDLGDINVELFPAIAPLAVRNFDSLVSVKFFDSTAFHRVVPNFVIQGGDPNSKHGPKSTWGQGDPSQPNVMAEFSAAPHLRGTLAAARDADVNSANSQFYICVKPQSGLDGNYTVYGQVISGINWVDTIVNEPRDTNDCPFKKIEMFVTYTGSNDSLPGTPMQTLPANGTQNVGISKSLKWTAIPGTIMYHFDLAVDSLFTSIALSKDCRNYPGYTVSNLQPSVTYYWRVKACNGGHWSWYSPVWKFSTTMNTAVQNLAFTENGYRLDQNIPNPANGQTIIKYVLPGLERVMIKLLDITGKEIAVLLDEEKSKGEYELSLNMGKYAAGTYFYTMLAGDVSDTKKIILEK